MALKEIGKDDLVCLTVPSTVDQVYYGNNERAIDLQHETAGNESDEHVHCSGIELDRQIPVFLQTTVQDIEALTGMSERDGIAAVDQYERLVRQSMAANPVLIEAAGRSSQERSRLVSDQEVDKTDWQAIASLTGLHLAIPDNGKEQSRLVRVYLHAYRHEYEKLLARHAALSREYRELKGCVGASNDEEALLNLDAISQTRSSNILGNTSNRSSHDQLSPTTNKATLETIEESPDEELDDASDADLSKIKDVCARYRDLWKAACVEAEEAKKNEADWRLCASRLEKFAQVDRQHGEVTSCDVGTQTEIVRDSSTTVNDSSPWRRMQLGRVLPFGNSFSCARWDKREDRLRNSKFFDHEFEIPPRWSEDDVDEEEWWGTLG